MGENYEMTEEARKSLEALHPEAKRWIMHHFGNGLHPILLFAEKPYMAADMPTAADHMRGDYKELVDAMKGRKPKGGKVNG